MKLLKIVNYILITILTYFSITLLIQFFAWLINYNNPDLEGAFAMPFFILIALISVVTSFFDNTNIKIKILTYINLFILLIGVVLLVIKFRYQYFYVKLLDKIN